MRVILLDIEGTTTPIDFVHKTLFPFAKARMREYLEDNFDDLHTEVEQIKVEQKKDFEKQIYGRGFDETDPDSVSKYLTFLIDTDRKSTPLKSIQGKIWRSGYKDGELKSIVFDDVPEAFSRWKSDDKTLAIYSSGSVLAQKLLFGHTNHGDLNPHISNYFDTITGKKTESISYKRISAEFNVPAREITFISDVTAELEAAKKAGLNTILSIREGNPPVTQNKHHRSIQNFDEV